MTVSHLCLIAALAVPACAPAAGTSSGAPRPGRSSTLLTADEIRTAHADGGTLYDAIARLRSNWLTRETRSYEVEVPSFASVFVEGQRYGGLESLRNIDVNQIVDARYYSAAEAGGRFGMQGGLTGVIEVTMKKR